MATADTGIGSRPRVGAGKCPDGRPGAVDRQGGGIVALHRAKSEWRKLLTPEQYNVLFEEETERPYSSPLDKEKRSGTYVCAACHLPLFTSQTKYDSGTGWPSFTSRLRGA